MRAILRLLGGIVLACLFVSPATSDEARLPASWTKICLEGICYIGKSVRSESGLVVAATLLEPAGEVKKILRVTVPAEGLDLPHGVRIVIDQGRPVTRPFLICFPNGCMADYEGGTELVAQLKQGRMLFLELADADNSPVNLSLPMIGFAQAYDGPPQ
jgi:invasion protein IalB